MLWKIEFVCVCVCVARDNIMILHRFGTGAALSARCHMSTKAHRNVGRQMWHWHSTQVSGKDTRAYTRTHTHLVLTLFMWHGKAPAGETHSTLYSLRTCDCGEKGRRKGKRGRREREAQVETLVFRDVRLSLKYKQKCPKVSQRAEKDRHFGQYNFSLSISAPFAHLCRRYCLLRSAN